MASVARQLGEADLVCCRHLLEHCRQPLAALTGLRQLAAKDGLVLIEVPDSTKFLARRDFSFVREEHVCYFTELTLRAMVARVGLSIVEMLRYDGLLEDAFLVAILQPDRECQVCRLCGGVEARPRSLSGAA